MLLGLYRIRALAHYIASPCPQPSYNLFAPAATLVAGASPRASSTRHEPTTSRITKDYHGTLRVGMHKADYAGRVRKNAIPLQDGLRMGSG
jgi:hypothetical protein